MLAAEGEEDKDDACHYVYVCRKRPEADKLSQENWPLVEEFLRKADEEDEDLFDEELNEEKTLGSFKH